MTFEEEYERGFVDGMQHQMKSSVDRAVNAATKKEWVGLTDDEVLKEFWNIYPEEDVLFTDVERAFYRAIENKLKAKNT